MKYLLLLFFFQFTDTQTDPNEVFIQKQLEKLDLLLDKNSFEKGQVYLADDTIDCEVLSFKKKYKTHASLFCVVKTDTIRIHRAHEIIGFTVKDRVYLTRKLDDAHFFIKRIAEGEIDLYKKVSIPSHPSELYYFTKNGVMWHKIDSNLNYTTVKTNDEQRSNAAQALSDPFQFTVTNTGVKSQFETFILDYTSDCVRIANGIKQGFYEISNFEMIVSAYNSCE